ncbi:hypothetical protein [Myxococcus stipitatus]|uniref:hypothetical protein n=1 Tax=Myxococcus stipitatus TaxID=83455 RepID=UPI0030CAD7C6
MNEKVPYAPELSYSKDGVPLVWFKPQAAKSVPYEFLSGNSALADVNNVVAQITQFQVSFFATSVDVAAKLSLGSIFSTSGSFGAKAIFYDAVATTDFYAEQEADNGAVLYGVRHGTGARLALRAQNLKSESNLSYAGLAAQARVSGAEVFYEVQGIGIPPGLIQDLLGVIPASGSLDSETNYTKLDEFLRTTLPDFLDDLTKPLTVSEYIVVPRTKAFGSTTGYSLSVNFAMGQLARRRSLVDALKNLDDVDVVDGIERQLVVHVYLQMAGLSDPQSDKRPHEDAARRAKEWLNV